MVRVYSRKGALSSLAGSMTTAQISDKTPCTAIPIIRNGNRISHTKGYAISASSARGQQITKSKHQRRNVSNGPPQIVVHDRDATCNVELPARLQTRQAASLSSLRRGGIEVPFFGQVFPRMTLLFSEDKIGARGAVYEHSR